MSEQRLFMLNEDVAAVFNGLYFRDLSKDLENGYLAIGGIVEEKPVSLLVFQIIDKEAVIAWLFVDPEYRYRWFATDLVFYLKQLSEETTGFSIKVFTKNADVIAMLRHEYFDFREVDAKEEYLLRLGDMIELPLRKNLKQTRYLRHLDEREMKLLNQFFAANRTVVAPVDLPIRTEDYHPLSRAAIKDGKVLCLVLMAEEEDALVVRYAFSGEASPMALMEAFSLIREKALELYGEEKKLRICTLNGASDALVKKLFPKNEAEMVYEGTWIGI